MRQKIENHLEVPDNDIEGYIPYYSIQDDVEQNDKTCFCVIFSTTKLMSFLTKSEVLHIDATYRLNCHYCWSQFCHLKVLWLNVSFVV